MNKFFAKFKNRTFQKKILVFLLVLTVGLFVAGAALAQEPATPPATAPAAPAAAPAAPDQAKPDDVSNWIGRFFSWVFSYVIGFEGTVLVLLTRVLLAIVKYNGFVRSPAVATGWTIVRDIANMFFVLVMLAIALGTILHIESYNFKRLLPKVLIMAVLVNFSRTLCGLAIDFAQVVMMTFAVGFASIAGAGDLMATLHITQMINASATQKDVGGLTNFFSAFITGLLAVILLLVAIVVVLVMVVVIVMRMIMLWLLVVLSPLPFVLSAFPAGQKYAQQWTQEFFKYVIVGPVLAFFLWLGLAISAQGGDKGSLAEMTGDKTLTAKATTPDDTGITTRGIDEDGKEQTTATTFAAIGDPDNFLAFLIGVGMLMGGLMITQQLGVAGGAFAGQMSNRLRQSGFGLKYAAKGAGKVYGYGARKIAAGALPGGVGAGLQLNPAIIYQGIKKSFAERREKELLQGQVASGKALEAGGIGGMIKGLGSGQDFADAYLKGFLNIRGFAAMGRGLVGGPDAVESIRRDEESEKKQAMVDYKKYENRKSALGLTDQDRIDTIGKMTITSEDESREFDNLRAEIESDPEKRREYEAGLNREYGKRPELGVSTFGMPEEEQERIAEENEEIRKDVKDEYDKKLVKSRLEAQGKLDQGQADELITKANSGNLEALRTISDKTDQHYKSVAARKKAEADRIAGGGFSDDEMTANQKKLLTVNERIAALLKRINEDKSMGRETAGLDAEMKKLIGDNKNIGNFDNATNRFAAKTQIDKVGDAGSAQRLEFNNRRQAMAMAARDEAEKNDLLSQASSWTEAQRDDKKKEQKKFFDSSNAHSQKASELSTKAEKYVPPRAFAASIAERSLVANEQKKITSELDTELIANFRDAVRDNDMAKASALARKLTADGNDNELWNAFGFKSDHKGMHDFFDAVMMGKKGVQKADGTEYKGPALKMNEQQALALESDVSFINEKINHWETARVVEVKDGRYQRLSEADHVANSLAEIMKKNPREISRSFNRLAHGGERPNPDGTRNFELSALGVAILRSLGQEITGNITKSGAEYNKNAVMNIGTIPDADLKKFGIGDQYIAAMRDKYNGLVQEAGTSIGQIVSRLFDEGIAEALERRDNT